jgi:hypothetical protein
MNKKGATLDNIFLLVKVFGFALFILIMYLIWAEFTSTQLNAELWDKTIEGQHIRENTQVAIDNLDWIFLVAYFGMHIGIIILAYFLRSHPIVYIAGIFIILILVIIAAPLSNVWEELIADETLIEAAANMPKTNYIMLKFPIFEVIFAFLTLICFAAFARQEGIY